MNKKDILTELKKEELKHIYQVNLIWDKKGYINPKTLFNQLTHIQANASRVPDQYESLMRDIENLKRKLKKIMKNKNFML